MVKKEEGFAFFKGRRAVLATMHKKEQVIAPVMENELGIHIQVPEGFDSDRYGTFTGEVERTGNQLEAARLKAEAAMELTGCPLAVSSEGSFGPHPMIPFLPCNREVVMLVDKDQNLEVFGTAITTRTYFKHKVISSFEEAYRFAESVEFPDTGIVVKVKEQSVDPDEMTKGITSTDQLKEAVQKALTKSSDGTIFIETDVRAMHNPKRMKNIEAATRDLVKNILSTCPACEWPGYKAVSSKKGLPCEWCRQPTELTLSLQYECTKCGYNEEQYYPEGIEQADPGQCSYCNP
ncbi:DUF6671 family protein [Alkalibacterium pelagium]|uniref:DUF6671 domain-containing protein n=1 Tax=Alkalibacterium pelagium TaxID=426702 RepID=A0A1H7FHV2_9LACT|nr:DUF6671 family protein [Alkalibacterium pelagium]GEN49393.1 hypothetical protein APE02nite_00580 [Alkalibacterium pelagium]SEK24022.1 hypothetical protein SAMN04488099_101276 [Alkalibacterium pelagium]